MALILTFNRGNSADRTHWAAEIAGTAFTFNRGGPQLVTHSYPSLTLPVPQRQDEQMSRLQLLQGYRSSALRPHRLQVPEQRMPI
jgi:hypothetical protein